MLILRTWWYLVFPVAPLSAQPKVPLGLSCPRQKCLVQYLVPDWHLFTEVQVIYTQCTPLTKGCSSH